MKEWMFSIITSGGLIIAYYLRFRISGENLNYYKFYFCVAINLFFFALNYKILKEQRFFFNWYIPTLRVEHPAIRWIALACLILHCFANPVSWKLKKWYSSW